MLRGGGIAAGDAAAGSGAAAVLTRGPNGLLGESRRLGESWRNGLEVRSVGRLGGVTGRAEAMKRDGSWLGAKDGREVAV